MPRHHFTTLFLCPALLLLLSCAAQEEERHLPGQASLLLKVPKVLEGVLFRPPCRVTDIKGFGWEKPGYVHALGIWLMLGEDSPVITPAPGTVTYADNMAGEGHQIEITHSDNVKSLLEGLQTLTVREGDRLVRDAVLGKATGVIRVQLYLKKTAAQQTEREQFRSAVTGEAVWVPVFTAPYLLGRGEDDAPRFF